MTTESAILDTVKRLPEPIKQAVLLYTEFLASQYGSDSTTDESTGSRKHLAGSLKGTFVLPLSEDFDKPLEDFEEYM